MKIQKERRIKGRQGKWKRRGIWLPILIDHIRDTEPLIDDLAPPIPVEVLGAQLAGRQEPGRAVAVGGVLVYGGEVLSGLQEALEAEEVAVDALTLRRRRDVLDVGGSRLTEQLDPVGVGGGRVRHRAAEGHAIVRHAAARLGAAELEPARGGRLVRGAVPAVHLVVRELDHQLHVGVGRGAELLDEALAVALVRLDGELVLADDGAEVAGGAVDLGLHLGRDLERDGGGVRQVRPHGRVAEVRQLVPEDHLVHVVVEPVRRRPVHHAVLPQEPRRPVVVHDELQRLVVPPVLPVAVPVLARALLERHGRRVVEAHDERSRLDRLERRRVLGRRIQEHLARIGPHVPILGGQGADGGRALRRGELVDAGELGLELGRVQLLAVDLVGDLEELVLADGEDVLVLLLGGVVLDGVVGGAGRHAAGVEHPLVAVHADGQLAHVLGLEGAGVDLGLELEGGAGEGGGALGRVPAPPVVAVRVEVADVGDDRVAVAQVGGVVPPLVYPVPHRGVLAPRHQLLLQPPPHAPRPHELLHRLLARVVLGRAQERVQALDVAGGGLFERRDGEAR